MNLTIALQYHSSDRPQAERLLRLIADIEPISREDVEVIIVRRFDSEPITEAMIYAASKFKVSVFTTHTPWKGWPAGANGMVKDFLQYSLREFFDPLTRKSDGILLIEPDCVPCSSTWLDLLAAEWAVALSQDKWAMGSWRNSGCPGGHLNGNMIVIPDLAARLSLDYIGQDLAWDVAIARSLMPHAHITGLIKNAFQTKNATEYEMRTPEIGTTPPVLYHGCKDDSAFNLARKWTL